MCAAQQALSLRIHAAGADGLHECRQDVTVAKLWEHCQMYHNAADNKQA